MLGSSDLPRQVTVGMHDPQSEIAVWLDGMSVPHDVTDRHVMACASPLTLGVVVDPEWETSGAVAGLSLRFQERRADGCVLGRIRLRGLGVAASVGAGLRLFGVDRTDNYCLPRLQLFAHYLDLGYRRRRFNNNPEVQLSAREAHAMIVFLICPRPAVLVTAVHNGGGNVFPMNLMGPVGDSHFAFALNSTRLAAPLVERAGRLAISNIPVEQAGLARQLGRNHLKESVDMNDLPFITRATPTFGFPVPDFAVRVRELEIEAKQRIGSHTFFIARTIHDEHGAPLPEFFSIHGIYQAWRLKHARA